MDIGDQNALCFVFYTYNKEKSAYVFFWPGHSRWLFSCCLYIPCLTSARFTYTLTTGLSNFLNHRAQSVTACMLAPGPGCGCPWSLMSLPFPLRRLVLSPACSLPYAVGCHSVNLLLTCKMPCLINHPCLCHSPWALSSVSHLSKCKGRPVGCSPTVLGGNFL